MAPTPIGSQLRAYTDKYVYLDAGHEEPEKLAFPSERLAISGGDAYFPTWSPDGNWLLTLQGRESLTDIIWNAYRYTRRSSMSQI